MWSLIFFLLGGKLVAPMEHDTVLSDRELQQLASGYAHRCLSGASEEGSGVLTQGIDSVATE